VICNTPRPACCYNAPAQQNNNYSQAEAHGKPLSELLLLYLNKRANHLTILEKVLQTQKDLRAVKPYDAYTND
jgi:hypothetical protein